MRVCENSQCPSTCAALRWADCIGWLLRQAGTSCAAFALLRPPTQTASAKITSIAVPLQYLAVGEHTQSVVITLGVTTCIYASNSSWVHQEAAPARQPRIHMPHAVCGLASTLVGEHAKSRSVDDVAITKINMGTSQLPDQVMALPSSHKRGLARNVAEAEAQLQVKMAELRAQQHERDRLTHRLRFVETMLPKLEEHLLLMGMRRATAAAPAGALADGPSSSTGKVQLPGPDDDATMLSVASSLDFSDLLCAVFAESEMDDATSRGQTQALLCATSSMDEAQAETMGAGGATACSSTQPQVVAPAAPASSIEALKAHLTEQYKLLIMQLSRSLMTLSFHPELAAEELHRISTGISSFKVRRDALHRTRR